MSGAPFLPCVTVLIQKDRNKSNVAPPQVSKAAAAGGLVVRVLSDDERGHVDESHQGRPLGALLVASRECSSQRDAKAGKGESGGEGKDGRCARGASSIRTLTDRTPTRVATAKGSPPQKYKVVVPPGESSANGSAPVLVVSVGSGEVTLIPPDDPPPLPPSDPI